MDYDIDLFDAVDEPFEVFQLMPSALSNPKLPRQLRRASLTFFVIDKLGNTPAFFPARVLDVKPLSDSPPLPLTDKTNANSTKPGSESASINKPPSSPRPGFKSLPPASQAEQAKPLFQEPSRSTESPTLEMQRGESAAAAKVSPDAQSVAIEPRAASNNLALNASSVPANQTQSNDEGSQKGTNAAQQPFVKKTQTTPQQVLPRTVNISPSTTTKSAIPPTFTPNASPSFTSPTNTKPKHKSPLGSQPPIFAADSGSKYSSTHHSAADLEKAAHNLATIGFLEPHGILQQYIEHTATTAIEEALRQFEREEPLRAARESYI